MDADIQSKSGATFEEGLYDGPRISVCESSPDTSVFLERGNTDGWIASDVVVDVTQ